MMPALDRLDHVHVIVADRAAAAGWYRDVLGFGPVAALASWAPEGGPLMLQDASGAIRLALFEAEVMPTRSIVAFGVDAAKFEGWLAHLGERLGSEMMIVDHEIAWSVYFSDPDGNPFEVICSEHAALAPAMAKRSDVRRR